MFGIKHIKFDSMTYVLHFTNGNIKREGRGLSFFYFAPNSSIAAIPMGSNDLPFIFNESTNDYQTVNIQGQISYKISNPKTLADVLDFTVNDNGQYKKSDIEKLNQRIINEAQTATSSFIHEIKLKDAIRSAKSIEERILEGLKSSQAIAMLGIDILGANILGIQATPEMARALETETREKLQQEADQAIYERRNFAVEQERKIKETELNTEIAVEEKQKQIAEKKMESEVQKSDNDRKLCEMKWVHLKLSHQKMLKFGKPIYLIMTESTFVALAQQRYAKLQALNKIDNFYDYEKEFEKIWVDLGREVLEANLSELSADRRKKKHLPNLEK